LWNIASTPATRDTVLYAKWDINYYTVTYMRNPDVVHTTQTAAYNTLTTAPSPAPDSTGNAFEGWYADAAHVTAWNFSADAVTSDTTLYAKWRRLPQQITVTDPRYTVGLGSIVVTTPPSDYIKVSDTEYSVLYGDDFSFRPEYDYPYTAAASTVTVNGERIYPDEHGIYTLHNVQGAAVIDIRPGVGIAPPVIERPVDIVGMEGVTVSVYVDGVPVPGPGRFYVKGHADFVFMADYHGNLPLKVLASGYYSGNNIELTGDALPDGTYRYVLKSVTEPWTITFGPDLASGTTGNDAVGDATVYAYGNTLYVSSAAVSEAHVYNVAGVLLKILPCTAGETVKTALSGGIYFVVIDGKSWKVVIR
jgi:uncharacterized repeat protein (TIGR02543 family)